MGDALGLKDKKYVFIADFARLSNGNIVLQGVTPSQMFYNNIEVAYHDKETDLELTEQLYTARGA